MEKKAVGAGKQAEDKEISVQTTVSGKSNLQEGNKERPKKGGGELKDKISKAVKEMWPAATLGSKCGGKS